ncbi:MAG: hypothetical protein RQ763_05700 [Sulfurimonas sp.]|uniref:hypothetical protein n=1 Tax=Sulfurimonas sp. TaxID=2022749 RepID=UPI0028CD59ED|nr:hypothetical protein [Sulfurimonas sp.]MDT8338670.1 hypothetical protein [Sulfurimonas sp.]
MQRKNNILKTNPRRKRGAFAMIMAIAVIVIISTIMALSLSLTSETTKRTVDLYLYEQVALHAKSATELALLDIAQASPCTYTGNTYNFPLGCTGATCIYNAIVTPTYIYYDDPLTLGVNESPCDTAAGTDYILINTPEQNGSVLMDVTVSVNDANITTEPIRYFRRTIQKL